MTGDAVPLASDGARAMIALRGAEPVAWSVDGRDLLWSGDPAHWNRSAPVLFPVVGACAGGAIRVGGRAHPMPRHGFARDLPFAVVDRAPDRVRLRLEDGPGTLPHYPFAFVLEVEAALSAAALTLAFTVVNPGAAPLPYALGFHPAFPLPLADGAPEPHRVTFEAEEDPRVPDITPDGLLREGARRLPFQGRALPMSSDLFAQDALVLRDARSRWMRLEAPSGAAIAVEAEDFPHLVLWTRPGAPFLSLETWTGHADPEGFSGDIADKPGMRLLAPGASAAHRARLAWSPAR